MNRSIHIAGAVAAALLLCSAADAQMRAGGFSGTAAPARIAPVHTSPMARVSASPAHTPAQANRRISVIRLGPNGRVFSITDPFANLLDFDEIGVPGLGFDYPHLAAISGGLHNNFGRHEHHEHNFITPVFFSGFPYYDLGGYYPESTDYQQPPQQPQIIVIQQPVPMPAPQQDTSAPQDSAAVSANPAAAAAAPIPDVGEFILVRRDGKVLFASAFSVIGAQLQYVTPEGIRRTVPFTYLDAVATQEMNEARGTSVQFHN